MTVQFAKCVNPIHRLLILTPLWMLLGCYGERHNFNNIVLTSFARVLPVVTHLRSVAHCRQSDIVCVLKLLG